MSAEGPSEAGPGDDGRHERPTDAAALPESTRHEAPRSETSRALTSLDVGDDVLARLRAGLGPVADEAVAAIVAQIPSYAGLTGRDGVVLREAVLLALGHFFTLAAQHADAAVPLAASTSAAYDLGRGEARSGRSMDALQAAYRIGARVCWRGIAAVAADSGMGAAEVASLAELVFAYIDELAAASVAGHTDELDTTGRVRERQRERLARRLLAGASEEDVRRAADRAAWELPTTVTCVALPARHAVAVTHHLDPRTLQVSGDLPGIPDDLTVLLIPDLPDDNSGERARLRRLLTGREGVIGPSAPTLAGADALRRLARGLALLDAAAPPRSSPAAEPRSEGRPPHRASGSRDARPPAAPPPSEAVDLDDWLVELVVHADPHALARLRERALAPLAGVRPSSQEALIQTLRSWLLHQGRRAAVAAELHVHPQTVRYRMDRARELYGDQLEDPRRILELIVALATAPPDASAETDS